MRDSSAGRRYNNRGGGGGGGGGHHLDYPPHHHQGGYDPRLKSSVSEANLLSYDDRGVARGGGGSRTHLSRSNGHLVKL